MRSIYTVFEVEKYVVWIAHFSLEYGVNSHNCRIWTNKTLIMSYWSSMQPVKLTAVDKFTALFMIGSLRFVDPRAIHLYYNMVLWSGMYHFLTNLPESNHLNMTVCMHGGASQHMAVQVMELLLWKFLTDHFDLAVDINGLRKKKFTYSVVFCCCCCGGTSNHGFKKGHP